MDDASWTLVAARKGPDRARLNSPVGLSSAVRSLGINYLVASTPSFLTPIISPKLSFSQANTDSTVKYLQIALLLS